MSFEAKIIADSVSTADQRLTTFQLRYPRFIHAEELTHRVLSTTPEMVEIVLPDGVMYDRHLSRNASSSRAIPVKRLIEDVLRDPAMPIYWGKNQPGMQARQEHNALIAVPHFGPADWEGFTQYEGSVELTRENAWLHGRDLMVGLARAYDKAGYHKQIVNRLLEPWAHINVVVTATEWDNFFKLRLHPDAQPEIHFLAQLMRQAMDESVPVYRDWHLPYVSDDEFLEHSLDTCAMLSSARCARTSYVTHDLRPPEFDADKALSDQLREAPHLSPFEHAAIATPYIKNDLLVGWASRRWHLEHFEKFE